MYPAERRFTWYPLAGQRHAIERKDRDVPLGAPMHTLCGAEHPRAAAGDLEWLWHTCELCWDATCADVGIRPRR